MKKHYKKHILCLTLAALAMTMQAKDTDNKTRVLVYDTNNMPIPGVVIQVKGKDKQTTTDADGAFVLDFNDNDMLVFKHIGYLCREERVKVKKNHTYI